MLRDYHVHTTFSDGKNTPEEMLLEAIARGADEIGFSDHSFTEFDLSYCMTDDKGYRETVNSLKEKYKDKIKVFCGIEKDLFSNCDTSLYDYVIGSVHYLKFGEEYIPVDENADKLRYAAEKYFDGDMLGVAEHYFAEEATVARITDCDIIGHFDLITKFNEKEKLFDETNPRYVAAAKKALDILLESKKMFEINSGAISRGYRTTPYPSKWEYDYILANGGSFIHSSDSHNCKSLFFFADFL